MAEVFQTSSSSREILKFQKSEEHRSVVAISDDSTQAFSSGDSKLIAQLAVAVLERVQFHNI